MILSYTVQIYINTNIDTILSAHPVHGVSRIQCCANQEVATILSYAGLAYDACFNNKLGRKRNVLKFAECSYL